jgi:excisionase family DNA binding protein
MTMTNLQTPELLTPSEVATMFRVDPKTVTRWAQAGKLNAIRTLGGHRRYRADEVHALLTRPQTGKPGRSGDRQLI